MAGLPTSLHFCDQLMLTTKGRDLGKDVDACAWPVPNDTNVHALCCRHLRQQETESICSLKLGFHWIGRFHHALKIAFPVKSSSQFHYIVCFQQPLKYNDWLKSDRSSGQFNTPNRPKLTLKIPDQTLSSGDRFGGINEKPDLKILLNQ